MCGMVINLRRSSRVSTDGLQSRSGVIVSRSDHVVPIFTARHGRLLPKCFSMPRRLYDMNCDRQRLSVDAMETATGANVSNSDPAGLPATEPSSGLRVNSMSRWHGVLPRVPRVPHPLSSDQQPSSGRRVRSPVAIAVVLLSLALGVMLGLLFPPETLLLSRHAPTKGTLATSPPVELANQETRAEYLASSAPEAPGKHEIDKLPSKATRETTEQVKATSEHERPVPPVTKAAGQKTLKRTNPAEIESKRGRRLHSERSSRSNRNRYAAPERPQRSIVSQLPIVGPVFGLLLP